MGANPIGKKGEIIAANYLAGNGYEILDMNFENTLGYRVGEIDIVAKDLKTGEIVFAEIKTRRKKDNYSSAAELAINKSKYRKLAKIISAYLRYKRMDGADYRLDAIAIEMDVEARKASLKHLKYIYY